MSKSQKRLVTLQELLRIRILKFGWGLLLLLILFGFPALMVLTTSGKINLGYYGAILLFVLSLVVAFVVIPYIGEVVATRALEKENVELLTSEKAYLLPAEQSLVRASNKPVQEQEKVLLRAAANAEDTPPDQLLRPDIPQ